LRRNLEFDEGKYFDMVEESTIENNLRQTKKVKKEVDSKEVARLRSDVFAGSHKLDVEDALRAGKPVPQEVLADYPDLAAKYPKSASTAQTAEGIEEGVQEAGKVNQPAARPIRLAAR
jgi:hypothetical protein